MRSNLEETKFSFVNYAGPRLSQDPQVRRSIRQHAMKDVAAARRRRGDYGQQNIGQFPQSLEQEGHTTEMLSGQDDVINAAHTKNTLFGPFSDNGTVSKMRPRKHRHSVFSKFPTIIRFPCSDLAFREDFALLLHLLPLTGLRLGIATFQNTIQRPRWSIDLLTLPHLNSRQLLTFIPSRYGKVATLRYATDCVVAKLREITQSSIQSSSNSEASTLLHYNKALRALQEALDDQRQRLTPETLCATVLLGAFEVCQIL